MRVLWATLHRPHPAKGGGWSHSWEMLSHAGRRHEITLLCAGLQPGERPAELAALDVDARGVAWRPHAPASRRALVWEALRGPGSEHFRSVLPAVRALREALCAAQKRQRYDLVFVWGGELAPLLAASVPPTACYVTDANTTYLRRQLAHAPSPRHRLLYALDVAHVMEWERTRYRAATRLATTSSAEALVLERLSGRRFAVVPVALGAEWFVPAVVPRERELVTIVAGLDYAPNVDGIVWFARECWPLVLAARPAARLRVIGRSPSPELCAALDLPGIEVLADVPDARPHYWRATVAVIPLRIGSGVKNKLLHAFACGAPVVGTSVAAEGTDAVHRKHALIADAPGALADAVLDVLSRPDAAALRAAAARDLAEPYRSERVADALESLWRSTAAGGPFSRGERHGAHSLL